MKNVKFRGKTKDGKWVFGYLLSMDCIGEISGCHLDWFEKVLPETVGQYTGVDDMFETPIYEGDLLDMEIFYYPLRVEFHRGSFMAIDSDNDWWRFRHDNCMVIGNIHDNPK